jgi:hypothetical protein
MRSLAARAAGRGITLALPLACVVVGLAAAPLALVAQVPSGTGTPPGLEGEGPERTRLLLDARLRYEAVEDAAYEAAGRALTGRIRAGMRTARRDGVGLLVEFDATRALGVRDFNSTVNGRTDRPVVADPDSRRLNRLHLSWAGDDGTEIVVGRQRIVFDDSRFISNSGFRQNEQTFDAARVRIGASDRPTFEYAHAWRVNRTSGSRSPVGREGASLHLLRGAAPVPGGTLTTVAYYQAFDDALIGQSNRTLGARYVGTVPVGQGAALRIAASLATQREHADNPASFSLRYGRVDLGLRIPATGLEATATLESLGGNGERGFAVPLTSGHGFQGFSGAIGSVPASGLDDRRLELAWVRSTERGRRPFQLRIRKHDFQARSTNEDLGQEWNLSLRTESASGLALIVEFADYQAPDSSSGVPSDLQRGWITLEYVRR